MPNRTRNPQTSRAELAEFILSVLPKTPDFELEDHGSLFLLRPLNDASKDWMNEKLPMDRPETQFWGSTIVIEPRYVPSIVEGIIADGMLLR